MAKTMRELAVETAKFLPCNCDLDNWEPERSTGHSHVCRIHKTVMQIQRGDGEMPTQKRSRKWCREHLFVEE